MEASWKIRLLLCAALFAVIAGEWLGYGSSSSNNELDHNKDTRGKPTTTFLEERHLEIDADFDEASQPKLTTSTVKADCLPKLVCELAGQPASELGNKELNLLSLIRSSGMGSTAEVLSRWHYAAHMGQLLGGSGGCAALWPKCPLPPTTLLGLTRRIVLKH